MPSYAFPRPIATVDVVLFTVVDEFVEAAPDRSRPGRARRNSLVKKIKVALIERASDPLKGQLNLPGTFVRTEEDATLLDAANRVLREKCGLEGLFVEQLATHGDATRDPRGWCITTVYYALVPPDILENAKERLNLVDAVGLTGLPFDHDTLVAEGLARIAGKATYTTLPAMLLPKQFTMTQLEESYEAIIRRPLDANFFRRKMLELHAKVDGIEIPYLSQKGHTNPPGGGRPAALYEKATDELITFPQRF